MDAFDQKFIIPLNLPYQWGPADHNLLSWAYDPTGAQAGTIVVAGTLNLCRLILRAPSSLITNVLLQISSSGVGLTAGQNFAGLWSASGALLGVTADQSGVWNAGGVKTMALTTPVTALAGAYYVGFWANAATTLPSFARDTNLNATLTNVGLAAAASRFASADTGLTTTAPNPFTGITASAIAWWAAVS